jgi:Tol biopolymer transport system component
MTNYSVGDGTGEIWVMDADGANARRLTENNEDDRSPEWSPDGMRIAFTRSYRLPEGRGRAELLVYDLAAGREYLIRGGPGYNYAAVWSPDGAWLAFTGTDENPNNRALYVARPDGSAVQPLAAADDTILTGAGLWLR